MSNGSLSDGSSIASMSNGNGGSSSIANMSNGRLVDGHVVFINDGSLDDVLDGVDLVGLRNGIGLGNLNGVRFGHVLFNNNFPFDGDGNGNGDLDGVFVNLKLGLDASHFGGDDGVSPDRGSNLLDSDGISGSGSLVGGCRRNSSIGSRGGGDDGGCNGDGVLSGLGGLSNISVGGGLADGGLLGISVSSLDSLGANLDGSVSDDLMSSVSDSRTGMNMFLDGVSNNSGGTISYMAGSDGSYCGCGPLTMRGSLA